MNPSNVAAALCVRGPPQENHSDFAPRTRATHACVVHSRRAASSVHFRCSPNAVTAHCLARGQCHGAGSMRAVPPASRKAVCVSWPVCRCG
ncbi:hypothetical protein OZ10_01385 [Xanthomonas cannabis pv. cannabis]|nr:hypothetical protein OZ10_01385 [Xanthomonas cannabis pv. cannabis]